MIQYTLKNSNKVTITPTANITLTSNLVNAGFNSEKKSFIISGRVPHNTPTIIATVKVEAFTKVSSPSDRRFLTQPNLLRSISNAANLDITTLTLKLKTTTRDATTAKNIKEFEFDLIYKNNRSVTISEDLKYDFTLQSKTVPTEPNGLTNVLYGSDQINKMVSKRKIIIRGAPNAKWYIAINKIIDIKDSSGNITSSSEVSILNKHQFTRDGLDTKRNLTTGYGVFVDGISQMGNVFEVSNLNDMIFYTGQLGKNGKFSFFQTFPSETTETRYSINVRTSIVSQDNFYLNTTSNSFSSWTAARDGFSKWSSKILTQRMNPTLTLRATTNSLLYDINGQTIPGSGEQTYNLTYTGRPNATRRDVKENRNITTAVDITYLLDATAANTFGTGRVPVFSKTFERDGLGTPSSKTNLSSDWTNSIISGNGGTDVTMTNISLSAVGSGTITLKLRLIINKWGNDSVVMKLDLDNIIAAPS